MPDHFILAAIQPCITQGRAVLGEELYDMLTSHLQDSISNNSLEDQASNKQVLIFRFERLIFALNSIYGAFDSFRKNILPPTYTKSLPIKIVLHLQEQNSDEALSFDNPDADLWNSLHYEKLYITRSLKLQWPKILAEKKDILYKLNLGEEGLYRVDFTKRPDFYSVKLFSHRHLPLQGKEAKECFYCGMRSHIPRNCPSKLLGMEHQGTKTLGYHSFLDISNAFEKVFKSPQQLPTFAGIANKSGQSTKELSMLAYLAYFDIFTFFQMRFLFKMSFSVFAKWEAAHSNEKIIVNDSNLNLALDCLRVGKYELAEEKLAAATGHNQEKLFYGYVGRAFLALEKGRYNDMAFNLDTALTNASTEKEKIYINILLYRFFKVTGDLWKAQYYIKALLKLKPDLIEANYYNVLIDLSCGFCEKGLSVMHSLINGPREFFITLLLDPQLTPMQGFIDEMLLAKVESETEEARQQISRSRSAVQDIQLWLPPEDTALTSINESLHILEEQHQSSNYYDIVDICHNSKELCQTCRETRTTCLDSLAEKHSSFLKKYKKYAEIWRLFLFKRFFKNIDQELKDVSSNLTNLDKLIRQDDGESAKLALSLSTTLDKDMSNLHKTFQTIRSLEIFFLYAKGFSKKLLITEVCALTLFVLIFFGFSFIGWAPANDKPLIQKEFLLIIFLVIAPSAVFFMTLLDIKKKNIK